MGARIQIPIAFRWNRSFRSVRSPLNRRKNTYLFCSVGLVGTDRTQENIHLPVLPLQTIGTPYPTDYESRQSKKETPITKKPSQHPPTLQQNNPKHRYKQTDINLITSYTKNPSTYIYTTHTMVSLSKKEKKKVKSKPVCPSTTPARPAAPKINVNFLSRNTRVYAYARDSLFPYMCVLYVGWEFAWLVVLKSGG